MSTCSGYSRARLRGPSLAIVILILVAIAAATPVSPARAETVFDAMRDAFARNPAIAAERERLQATGTSVQAAQAGFLPTVSASADIGLQQAKYASAPDLATRQKPYGWSATMEQPLFDGGAALAAVRRATASVRAGQHILLSTESSVLLAAATAFADVQRGQVVVALQSESATALVAVLAQARERRNVGDATVADLSQSDAAAAGAELQLALARSALADAQARFLEIVGRPAGVIESSAAARVALPERLDDALLRADTQHPAIRTAREQETAARHAVDVAMAKYPPTVTLQASYQNRRDLEGYIPATTQTQGASIEAVARIPLYTGGSIDAEVRAARHTQLSLGHEIERTRAAVRTGVASAWNARTQNEKALGLLARQVEAGKTALAALRKEQAVGQRTLTDVLTAERELVAARVSLAEARHDATVTRLALLASVGDLTSAVFIPAPRNRAVVAPAPQRSASLPWTTVVQPTSTRLVSQR